MTKNALVFLAEGAEEMETVITVDVLRRAGVQVTLASIKDGNQNEPVTCSRNVRIFPDTVIDQIQGLTFDAVVIPGGLKGAESCANDKKVGDILREHFAENKLVCAICAGPTVLLAHKIGLGKSVTSYPSFREKLEGEFEWKGERVVRDENLVTSQGPGTSFEFALKIVAVLLGDEKSQELAEQMILKS